MIKAQCRVQGVSEKHAERIEKISGITEEKDGNIIAAVKNFKENILPVIEEAEKASSEAARKAIEEYEKKHNLKDGKSTKQPDPNDPPKKEEGDGDTKKEIADLKKMLQVIIDKQASKETLESVRAKLKGKIDDDFIDDYIGQVKLDADDIDAEIERVVKSYTDMQQRFLNKAVQDGNYQPVDGSNVGDKSVEEWKKIMNGSDQSADSVGVVDLGLN